MSTKWWTERLKPHKMLRPAFSMLLAVSIAVTSGCALLPKEDEEEVLPTITPPKLSEKPTYPVARGTIEARVQGIGKLMSTREETLFISSNGEESGTTGGTFRVKDVHVKSGDTVTAGQLIAELDVAEKQRELRRKKLEFRKEELSMIDILRKSEDYEPEELEQLKIDFELKRTSITELEEAVANAQVTAPFAGSVVSVHVKKGDSVQAYAKVAVIADLSQLAVTAQFSQTDLNGIAVGMEAVVNINAAGSHQGKVERLPTQTSNNNGGGGGGFPGNPNGEEEQDTIDKYLVVKLNKWPEGVTRGTPLSVNVITNRKENAIIIPPAALRSYNGRSYVQVEDNEGNKREVDVEVGMQTATQVEIVKGLEPGQKVVGR